jgi:hypothetical protein
MIPANFPIVGTILPVGGSLKSPAGLKKIPDTKVSGIFVCSSKIFILEDQHKQHGKYTI